MNLNYSGSGIVIYNQNEYQCDLYINENQGGILIKISVNKSLASFLELPFSIKFLCGELNTGYNFSLVNCSRNKMENLISEGRSVYTYLSQYMFKGVGGKGCNCVKLYKVIFELSDIIEWGNISGYAVGENYELLQNVDLARTLFENEKISVKYVVNSNMLPVHFTEVLKEEIILKQNGNIEISFMKDESIDEFENIFRKIKRLIELSTVRNIHLNKLTGWSEGIYYTMDGDKRFDRAIDIISCYLKKDEKIRENRQKTRKWIALSELIANDSFANYFSKYELLEPVVDLYLEVLELTEMPPTRIFLNVVQALETYHSRFITNNIQEFKKRIELVILKNRPKESVQGDTTFLMANSRKFITLESRLADLLLGKFEVYFDTGDIKHLDFPNVIAKTRNYYIHYDEGIKANGRVLTEEEISIYNRTLLYMLEYYLLLELGFSDTIQIKEKLNERWGNASQTLSLIKMSKEIEKSSEDIPHTSNLGEIN
jgi:hypothetical protein